MAKQGKRKPLWGRLIRRSLPYIILAIILVGGSLLLIRATADQVQLTVGTPVSNSATPSVPPISSTETGTVSQTGTNDILKKAFDAKGNEIKTGSATGGSGSGGVTIPGAILPSQPPGTPASVETLISKLFTFGISVTSVIFIIMFFIGGIMYLTAGGNEEQAKRARSLLIDAIIGLIIVLGAWAISTFVLKELGAK